MWWVIWRWSASDVAAKRCMLSLPKRWCWGKKTRRCTCSEARSHDAEDSVEWFTLRTDFSTITSKTHFWSFLNYPLLSLSQINEQKRDDTAGTYYQPLLWYITLFTIKLYSPLKILFPCQRMRSNILLFKSLVSWNGGRHQLVRQHPASQLRRVLPSAYWRCAERGCTLMHQLVLICFSIACSLVVSFPNWGSRQTGEALCCSFKISAPRCSHALRYNKEHLNRQAVLYFVISYYNPHLTISLFVSSFDFWSISLADIIICN